MSWGAASSSVLSDAVVLLLSPVTAASAAPSFLMLELAFLIFLFSCELLGPLADEWAGFAIAAGADTATATQATARSGSSFRMDLLLLVWDPEAPGGCGDANRSGTR